MECGIGFAFHRSSPTKASVSMDLGELGELGEDPAHVFGDLHRAKQRELSLELENNELRRSLRKSTSDVALAREYELLCQERERMAQLVEQLRLEKEHLIETMVNLSNDVDEAHRQRFDDSLKFKQEILRHSEDEKAARRLKYQMGLGIIDILKASGSVDLLVLQEVQMHITNASFSSLTPTGAASSSTPLGGGPFSTAAKNDDVALPPPPQVEGEGEAAGGFRHHFPPHQQQQQQQRRRRHRRRTRSRQYLERDEDGSDISSVSTHRSEKTIAGHDHAPTHLTDRFPSRSQEGSGRRRSHTQSQLNEANERIGRTAQGGANAPAAPQEAGGCIQT